MNIVKKISYGVASFIATAPAMALAQFQEPTGTGLPAGSLLGIVTAGMNWALILVGILGVLGFVISGIMYLISSGDEDMIGRAKKTMINSIIGIIVALIGIIVIQAVKGLLSGSSKSF